ncbi:Opt2p [Ascoidea rubescens DSM 1968]|uniref:Small oligopeptide transporter n=1 Tax=Ascoidea rubescens DSM 1968 TaxID=1344418 RepID=A0A1D2VNI4_9ASCO|nr:small oligopeptide transporter [Ascoidea rubescens DSM 1968]ODV63163.1 small oligopeptide transporter [Ascoidea rubescens DSM 1968]
MTIQKENYTQDISFDDLSKVKAISAEKEIKFEKKVDYIGTFKKENIKILLEKTGHGTDDTLVQNLPDDTEFILNKIYQLTVEESIKILENAIEYHNDDPNFPNDDYELMKTLVKKSDLEKDKNEDELFQIKLLASLIHYLSPYPEVRAVTDPFDEPDIPIETIRSYTLAILWVLIGSAVNEFFSHRYPSISLSSSVIQILMYPCGKFWAWCVPDWGFTYKGKRISLNPGPWTYKEQMFSTLLYAITSPGVYITYNVVVQKLEIFYNNKWCDFGFQFLLAMSTQFLGFGIAGILRKFVVYPVRAMWPTILPTLALNRALLKPEKKERIHGWKLTKYQFFFIFFLFMFLYFWLPNYLFQALSYFNWITWIDKNNFNLAVICGQVLGLGLNPIPTFDWNVANYLTPLTVPFFANMNIVVGIFLAFFAITGVYYNNYYWSAYLPVNSNAIFTNKGESYQVTQILTNGLLDKQKYQSYSPPYYTAANLVVYGAFFAIYPFSFMYTCYIERRSLIESLKEVKKTIQNWKRSNFEGFTDPHSRMMAKYKEVPDWWFLIIVIVSLVFAILAVSLYPTHTPVWLIFMAFGMNIVFLIPFALIYSTTGFSLGLNVLVELICGYALPGNGVALMTIKALGYNIGGQADNYISNQKMAHYSKIPPLALFRGQIITTTIQVLVVLGVVNWQISNVDNFCQPGQKQRFTCPSEKTFYSASVFWGVIGPKRVFSEIYPLLEKCFLIGFLLGIFFILVKRFLPRYFPNIIQPTLIMGGFIQVFAPYNLMYVIPGIYLSFTFMYYIKKHYLAWFEKYNYVLVSSFDAGVAFSALIMFFAVQYHNINVNWWGNLISFEGVDGGVGRQSLLDVASTTKKYFGYDNWS